MCVYVCGVEDNDERENSGLSDEIYIFSSGICKFLFDKFRSQTLICNMHIIPHGLRELLHVVRSFLGQERHMSVVCPYSVVQQPLPTLRRYRFLRPAAVNCRRGSNPSK